MGAQRDRAIAGMKGASETTDFMHDAGIDLPEPYVPGALPAMTREMNTAQDMRALMDVVILFGIGDFDSTDICSTYYDPSSPWYNVFYGAYAVRSYKRDGSAWGYDTHGNPNFDELLLLSGIDYNFLTAAEFGCPPPLMCFSATATSVGPRNGWDIAAVSAHVPSGLHDPTQHQANPRNYIVFGKPQPAFLQKVNQVSYEPVPVRGQFHMCPIKKAPIDQWITLVWGAACPDTEAGSQLLLQIVAIMDHDYAPLARYRSPAPTS